MFFLPKHYEKSIKADSRLYSFTFFVWPKSTQITFLLCSAQLPTSFSNVNITTVMRALFSYSTFWVWLNPKSFLFAMLSVNVVPNATEKIIILIWIDNCGHSFYVSLPKANRFMSQYLLDECRSVTIYIRAHLVELLNIDPSFSSLQKDFICESST